MILPRTGHLKRYRHIPDSDLMGIPVYGRPHGQYKISRADLDRACGLDYYFVSMGSSYAYVRDRQENKPR